MTHRQHIQKPLHRPRTAQPRAYAGLPLNAVLLSATLLFAAGGCAQDGPYNDDNSADDALVPENPNADTTPRTRTTCNDAELHVVSVYTGDQANHSNDIAGQANVHITRPGPAIVVLSAYEPMHWTVTADEHATIERVILNGYYEQSATVPQGTQLDAISFYITRQFWYTATTFDRANSDLHECRDFFYEELCDIYEEEGVDWRRTIQLPIIPEAERVTGAALTTFHGCHDMSKLTIMPHEAGGAPQNIPNDCNGNRPDGLDVHFAADTGVPPAVESGESGENDDSADSCGAPLPQPPPVPTEGPCAGESERGLYQGKYCGFPVDEGRITTEDIYCTEALENCLLNADLNPDLELSCAFNGRIIYGSDASCQP